MSGSFETAEGSPFSAEALYLLMDGGLSSLFCFGDFFAKERSVGVNCSASRVGVGVGNSAMVDPWNNT